MIGDLGVPQIRRGLMRKLGDIRWGLVGLIVLIGAIGCIALYSAAGGSFEPWAWRQGLRLGFGLGVMLAVALIDIRIWFRSAYLVFGLSLALLLAVTLFGSIAQGAQRWLDLGIVQVQPSEIVKIALVLALARYFHGLDAERLRKLRWLVPPLALVLVPAALVLLQPDLGTAVLLAMAALAMFWLAGVRFWQFAAILLGGLSLLPFAWQHLQDYQKRRLLTFLDPESDPLGAGYQILQSKIAIGSGGVFGKGFLQGSQSQLQFLPEKQTDLILTTLAEEFGLIMGLVLLILFALALAYCYAIALRARSLFARLMVLGLGAIVFAYVFVNVGMVSGILPVVGLPLPLVSYGGSAMMTILIGFGLVLGAYVHRDTDLPRNPSPIPF
jgi:rod shape determining protein RodA